MRIGLLSDTHGYLDEAIFRYFEECDEIWHAGDVGNLALIDKLMEFKPFFGVWGNIDPTEVRTTLPETQLLTREGVRTLMIHIAGPPLRYNPQVKVLIKEARPHLLVCGHSHLLKVQQDPVHGLLYINPGAAGKHGFHKIRTLLRFTLLNGRPSAMEVIELGPRARI